MESRISAVDMGMFISCAWHYHQLCLGTSRKIQNAKTQVLKFSQQTFHKTCCTTQHWWQYYSKKHSWWCSPMRFMCAGDEVQGMPSWMGRNHCDSRVAWDLEPELHPWAGALMENDTYTRHRAPGFWLLNTHGQVSHLTVSSPEVNFRKKSCCGHREHVFLCFFLLLQMFNDQHFQ